MSTVTAPGHPRSIASCFERPKTFTMPLSSAVIPCTRLPLIVIGSQLAVTNAVALFQDCRPVPKPEIVPDVKLRREADAANTPIDVFVPPAPERLAKLRVHSLSPMQLNAGSCVFVVSVFGLVVFVVLLVCVL